MTAHKVLRNGRKDLTLLSHERCLSSQVEDELMDKSLKPGDLVRSLRLGDEYLLLSSEGLNFKMDIDPEFGSSPTNLLLNNGLQNSIL